MSPPATTRGTPGVAALLWAQVIRRHWRREPFLTATLAAILALGVAVFLAVRLANKAAVSGFSLFTESIAGESDLILRPRAGLLPTPLLRELRTFSGNLPIDYFPVLELTGALSGKEEESLLRLVGVDLVAVGNAIAAASGSSGTKAGTGDASPGDADAFLREDAAFVGQSFAAAHGVATGERVGLWIRDRAATLEIAGILPDPPNRPALPENLVLLDLPALARLAGEEGGVSRVEVRFAEGADGAEIRAELETRLGAFAAERGLLLETPEDRKSSVTRMSAAFRLNLAILSGLALLVGTYLIMQALEAAVVKRRGEIAILRSLGVTPRQIRRAWLGEALALGLVGGVAGIVLGRLLASGLVGAISATVNTLYYQTTTRAVTLHWGEAAFSLAFGVAASLVAGWIPAREASLTPPAQALRQGAQGGGLVLLRRWPAGLLLLAAALACAFLPAPKLPGGTVFPLGGYLSALCAVLGGSVLLGLLFRPLARALGRGGDAMRRYAASRLSVVGGRHRLTAAGLSAAIGMSAAMAILVASFETTLTSWIGQILKADVYVASPGAPSIANGNAIAEPEWRRLLALPGVAGADTLQRQSIEFEGREILVGGATYHDDPRRRLDLLWVDPPARSDAEALSGEGAWVSEPFARRFGRKKGDVLELPTPEGTQRAEILGVYADYGNESGTVLLSRASTTAWFGGSGVSSVALYAEDGVDPEELLERVRAEFPALAARTNALLRRESIRIFHQTFAVTYALEAIAVLIAIGGLGLALAGLLLERKAELSTLRALGATRRDIARAAMWEGLGIALAGLAGGIGVSFLLGWILIEVINPQSFGWTLRYAVPWPTFALLVASTLAAAAAVAWAVGYRNANLRSDREE
jgi:putative ABC transport system permease protein